MVSIDTVIPYNQGELLALAHEKGIIEHQEHTAEGTHIQGWIPPETAANFNKAD
jgi:GTP-binding protein HflX